MGMATIKMVVSLLAYCVAAVVLVECKAVALEEEGTADIELAILSNLYTRKRCEKGRNEK